MVNWDRPQNVLFPMVWHTFQAKDSDSEEIVNYRVQDLPLDRWTEAVDHMVNYFTVDDWLCELKGLRTCPDSMAESRIRWEECIKQKLTIACFKEGSDELVGLNLIGASHKNDKSPKPKAKIWSEVYQVIDYIKNSVDLYDKFNTDVYMSSSGLLVAPKYRGRGIANQILTARLKLAKAVGLTYTSAVFTSIQSQKAAVRVGFQEVYSCLPDEFKSKGIDLPGINIPIKLMALKIS